ncbi:hypothetical protein [Anaerovirgula multivorans]|uniref:hypothetical protein n=1 Tax=Anaerovirgula multivorans TaxID=312168 RepID=UPI002E8E4AC3|nr:hypothetical protein [Anaerovirgula multivorans]
MSAINASTWINEKMEAWLSEKNVADTLSQSVQNNITSEMGLALLDVADVIRPYSEVIDYLQHVKDDNFLDELVKERLLMYNRWKSYLQSFIIFETQIRVSLENI